MTRETKIGLLVGLAFIIVIGILLSDHWNSSNEPPQAQVDDIGSNVRSAMGSPAAAVQEPPVTNVAAVAQVPPQAGGVRRQVLTPAELRPPVSPADPRAAAAVLTLGNGAGSPIAQVHIGPAARPHATVVGGGLPIAPISSAPPPPFVPAPPAATADVARPPSPLDEIAAANGQELVPVNGGGGNNPAPPAAPQVGGVKQYKAQPGDSLSRMAARLMGGDTKTNRDAIVRVNASLRQNPDRVIVGRTYNIPVGGMAGATAALTPVQPPAVRVQPQRQPSDWEALLPMEPVAEPSPAASRPQRLYTVREKESLWRIAAEQLGNGNAWTEIRDLNKDVLKGGEAVRAGMKLRLPAKPIAAAG